jgi:hypothetical protein
MKIKAHRVKKRLSSNDLTLDLKLSDTVELVEFNFSLDLSEFISTYNSINDNDELNIEDFDYEFSKIIYNILKNSSADESVFYDLRFWQWLSVEHLHSYCVSRWSIDLNNTKQSHYGKLLGGGGVGGFSLHSISRLFIPANILLREADGNNLLKSFFKIQQKEQSISQSTLALNPNLFVNIVKATVNLNTSETVKAISRLNARKSGLCIDLMSAEEISKLALENI